jgi:radical SAM protein with 4Fe4S-binding SPASM domain
LSTLPLTTLNIELTKLCYLECVHCSTLAGKNFSEKLSLNDIKKAIDDFIDLGGEILEISGGEPLCYRGIWEVLKYIKKNNLKANLFTCGFLDFVKPEKYELLAKKLKRFEIDKVTVSIHGSASETHDSITQKPGSFKNTINFIKKLVQNDNYVGIHFVPMNPNFEEIDYVVKLVEGLGVKEIGILRFVPQGRGKLNEKWLELLPIQCVRLTEIITEIRKKSTTLRIGSHLDFSFIYDSSLSPEPCKAGINKCLIQPDGNVLPCAVFKGLSNYVAGNIKTSSLLTIWNESKVFDIFREFMINNLKGLCATCEYLKVCRGRCPGQRVYKYNDFYQGPDPYCPLPLLNAKENSGESEIVKEDSSLSIKKIVILGSCKFEKEINEFVNQMKEKYMFLAAPKTVEKHNTEEGYLYARKIFEPAIKQCDEVWVWNQDGYLGEHTLRDIQLASFLKKKIKFLFPAYLTFNRY